MECNVLMKIFSIIVGLFVYMHYSGEDSCRIVQIGSTSKQSTYLESGKISGQNVISAHSVK